MNSKRGVFGSKLGVILASAGSAVGLGNIWRFPTEAGRNGGAAFILMYLVFIFVLAMPVMVSEFVIGRSSRANAVGGFEVLAPGKPWVITGFMGVLAGFLVLSYYSVVAGWTLDYTVASLGGGLMQGHDFAAYFHDFVTSPWRPVFFLGGFMLATHFVVASGVEKGIERYSKILMPMLFVIIILLMCFSLTMPGARKGIEFLLHPDFSRVTIATVLSAMGQAFFTLSVGISCLSTYASYFSSDTHLVKSAVNVCVIDTLVAICAGFIIFPAVFSVQGINPDAGPGLVFITLPNVFNMAFGGFPLLNYVFSGMFYILLLLAALTSSISMHEISTAYLIETFRINRHKAACIVTGICFVLGCFCSLSFGVWKDFHIIGMGFFDFFDYIVAKVFMPLGGILICTFVGWQMEKNIVSKELALPHGLTRCFIFLIRWVAPIGVGIIFIYQLIN